MSGAAGLPAAIVARLEADAGVMALAKGGVLIEARASAAFPFVAVGGVTARPWGGGDMRGREAVVTLEAYARQGGRDAALVLAEACGGVLDGAAFEMDGARVVGLFADAADAALEKDRQTWRARLRIRALVET